MSASAVSRATAGLLGLVLLSLWITSGCSSSDGGGARDGQVIVDALVSDATASDQGGLDAPPPLPGDSAPPLADGPPLPPADSVPPPADSAPPPADSAPLPADSAPVGPATGPVQCREDGDCGAGLTCNRAAPGGICLGCGACPGALVCLVAACVRECSGDGDCNLGMRCSALGRCLVRSCSAAKPCPAPYACGANNTCVRPACGGGAPACPPPLSCVAQRCVEP